MSVMRVIYTAAHSGIALDRVPIGGGGAVCVHLAQEWAKTKPFELEVLGPEILGAKGAAYGDLVGLSELEYARFCRDYETQTTQRILARDPRETLVLSNDVSEGPRFRELAERRYALWTIYHVDVVDYFLRIYGRSLIGAPRAVRLYSRWRRSPWRRLAPSIFDLIFKKQEESVFFSKGVIVPSAGMRDVLLSCYPSTEAGKIHAVPWGVWPDLQDPNAVSAEAERLRKIHHIPPGAKVLLTLSRISPEKGQDRLLKALAVWEKEADFPSEGLWVVISGEAAFMRGKSFLKTLHRLARRLRRARVIFPGYLADLQKQAYFKLADLYVFPSRHESYGLTLLEAMQAGLPALACDSYGAREVLGPDRGVLLPPMAEREIPRVLCRALKTLIRDHEVLKRMGTAARAYASRQRFSESAARLADLLLGI
jgi:starch synthase